MSRRDWSNLWDWIKVALWLVVIVVVLYFAVKQMSYCYNKTGLPWCQVVVTNENANK